MKRIIKQFSIVMFIFALSIIVDIIFNFNSVKAYNSYTISQTEDGKIKVTQYPYGGYDDGRVYDGVNDEFLYNIIDKNKRYIQIERCLNAKEHIIFPSEINGYKVKKIRDTVCNLINYDNYNLIKKITISEGIEVLGERSYDDEDPEGWYGAFRDLPKLQEVILPSTISKIGSYSFYSCVKLKKINFPENLKEISTAAFYKCNSLTQVKLGKNVKFAYESGWGVKGRSPICRL